MWNVSKWCRSRVSLAGLIAIISFALVSELPAQNIRARVVDEATRQPIAGATATLLLNNAVLTRATTNASGFFDLKPPSAGSYALTVEMLGYATQQREVAFNARDLAIPAFVLKVEAIAMDPLEATAKSRADSAAAVGFSRASQVLSGERLARLEQMGARPITLVREMSGLRVREFKGPSGMPIICVEGTRRMPSFRAPAGQCQWPVIVIDGVKVAEGSCGTRECQPDALFRELMIQDMESFEYVPPIEAGQLYGLDAGGSGALVIWTRGRGPHKNPDRDRK